MNVRKSGGTYSITNLLGQTVLTFTMTAGDGHEKQIYLPANGVYFLRNLSDAPAATVKFIVEQ